jgi:hypothetical protein
MAGGEMSARLEGDGAVGLRAGADEHALIEALDLDRFAEIARQAMLAASYWQSIALAADRGDVLTIRVHCHQVRSVTVEAFAIVKSLGEPDVCP